MVMAHVMVSGHGCVWLSAPVSQRPRRWLVTASAPTMRVVTPIVSLGGPENIHTLFCYIFYKCYKIQEALFNVGLNVNLITLAHLNYFPTVAVAVFTRLFC